MKSKFSIGEEITLVSKGIQRSEYSEKTWIDTRQKGRTSFFKVEKVGTKYLYGKYIRFEESKKELCYYQSRINPDDYTIIRGIHHDLKQAHFDFIKKLDEHKETRENHRRDIERQAQAFINTQMDLWDSRNPRPQNTL